MNKLLTVLWLFLPLEAISYTYVYPNRIDTVSELEKLYEESNIVFLANVEFEAQDEARLFVWNYSLISPAVKGSVKGAGKLYGTDNPCLMSETINKGFYLIGWVKEPEKLTHKNTIPIVYGEGKVAEEWALNWLKEKHITIKSK